MYFLLNMGFSIVMLVFRGAELFTKSNGVPLSFEAWKLQFKKMLKECVLLSKSSFSLPHLSYQQNCGGCCCDCCCCCCFVVVVVVAVVVVVDDAELFSEQALSFQPGCFPRIVAVQQLGQHGAARSFYFKAYKNWTLLPSLKLTCPLKNRPSQKDGQVFQASISRCENVSFREGITSWREKKHKWCD